MLLPEARNPSDGQRCQSTSLYTLGGSPPERGMEGGTGAEGIEILVPGLSPESFEGRRGRHFGRRGLQ